MADIKTIRLRILYAIFIVLAIVILAKIAWIQFGPDSAHLKERAIAISYSRANIEANRGDILTHDGRVLATSLPTFELRMDFAAEGLKDKTFNANVDSLAYYLSTFFKDKSKASYKTMLQNARANKAKNRYKLISPRRVNYLELEEIQKFPLFRLGANKGGFITNQVNVRHFPHGTLAARTIGRVNRGGAKWGIEGAFDEPLKGTDGNSLMQKVSGSFKVPVEDEANIEPVDGLDIVTTLDIDIQDVAETALKQQLEKGNAQWGSVVLMEVATGEIRAISNLTRTAPGVYNEDLNYAIGTSLEPGSTFKLATLMALLDDGGMKLTDSIDTEGGRATIRRKLVIDDHKEDVITLKKVFEVSSNIGFAKSVDSLYHKNPSRFVDYISSIGLADRLGVQIAGEAKPQIKRPSDKGSWDGYTLTLMSYGYALRLTPLHTLSLYNAIANDGAMMKPLLVKELRSYGQTIETFDPEVLNKAVCSRSTLKKVRECLEGVVNQGTAADAMKNPYYTVAAKTGTAQIAMDNQGYTDSWGGRNYLATLVGYFPADNPKYSCIVTIKTYYGRGSYKTFYGASLAGPVFRAIADQVYASNYQWQQPISRTDSLPYIYSAPKLKSGKISDITKVASKLDLEINKDKDIDQWAISKLDSLQTTNEVEALTDDDNLVPYVIGMGLKDAIYLLESRGLRVNFSGSGRVVQQSLRHGSRFNAGSEINIRLR